jgi:hypothetical protein
MLRVADAASLPISAKLQGVLAVSENSAVFADFKAKSF